MFGCESDEYTLQYSVSMTTRCKELHSCNKTDILIQESEFMSIMSVGQHQETFISPHCNPA